MKLTNLNMSFNRLLSRWLLPFFISLWLAGVLYSSYVVKHEMDEAFDKTLKESANAIAALISDQNGLNDQEKNTIRLFSNSEEYLEMIVRDASGNVIMRSQHSNSSISLGEPRLGFHQRDGFRFYGTQTRDNKFFVEVAEPSGHRLHAVFEASVAIVIPIFLFAPLSLFTVWWTVKRSTVRLTALKNEIESRGNGDLSAINTERLPEEFEPVATEVNRLMERLRLALEAERSFTANSAHELRTPIATAMAKLQRLKATVTTATTIEKLDDIEQSLKSLTALSEKLLDLAKADGGSVMAETPQNLSPVLEIIARDFERQYPDRLEIALMSNEIMSHLDVDAFAILIRNLIENAIKYGSKTKPITITFAENGELSVRNSCDVVAADKLASLHARFVRAHTGTMGSGIGLAIVDTIAKAADTSLVLASPIPGQTEGFEASVRIPCIQKTKQ